MTDKYLDEDILFLILKLIDYPDCDIKTYNFDKLKFFNFKKPVEFLAIQAILEINEIFEIKLTDFEFNRDDLFYLDKRKDLESFFQKHETKSKPLKNIIENKFCLSDIKNIKK